jgi:hypothetical protein
MTILMGGPLGGINLRSAIAQALEPETVTYFAAMDAASESYWPSEVALIDSLVRSFKLAGVWGKIFWLWFPVGASLTGALRALKHPLGVGTVMQNFGFAQAQWNRLVGLDQRTVTARINTLTTENQYGPSTDFHALIISEAEAAADPNARRDIGTGGIDSSQLISGYGSACFFWSMSANGISGAASPYPRVGIYGGTSTVSGVKIFKNQEILATAGALNQNSASGSAPMYIFSANSDYSRKLLSGASLGKGLSDGEWQSVYTALQSARTARTALTPP